MLFQHLTTSLVAATTVLLVTMTYVTSVKANKTLIDPMDTIITMNNNITDKESRNISNATATTSPELVHTLTTSPLTTSEPSNVKTNSSETLSTNSTTSTALVLISIGPNSTLTNSKPSNVETSTAVTNTSETSASTSTTNTTTELVLTSIDPNSNSSIILNSTITNSEPNNVETSTVETNSSQTTSSSTKTVLVLTLIGSNSNLSLSNSTSINLEASNVETSNAETISSETLATISTNNSTQTDQGETLGTNETINADPTSHEPTSHEPSSVSNHDKTATNESVETDSPAEEGSGTETTEDTYDYENETLYPSTEFEGQNSTDDDYYTSEEPEMTTTIPSTTTSLVTTTTTTVPPPPDCPSDLFIKLDAESDARRIQLNWTLHYNISAHPYFQLQDFEFYVFHDEIRIFDHVHVNYQDVDKNLTAGVKHKFCIGIRIIDQGRDCPVEQKRACKKAALEVKEKEPNHGTGLTIAFVILVIMVLIAVVAIKLKKRAMNFFYGRVRNRSASAMIMDILPSNTKPVRVHYNRPIAIAQFDFHFRLMSADSKLKFSVEFEELNADSPIYPYTAALLPENQGKNRWTNILPFDHSRAKLLPIADDLSSDYINANYIPGYTSQREYIATQGPLPHTVDDFWRMIWEQGTSVIVMLTQCVERGKLKCEEYWPTDQKFQYYGDLAICLKSESVLPEYSIRIFDIQLGSRTMEVKQIHFTMWPDFGCPENTQILLDFVKSVRTHVPFYPKGPIVVHCSAGVGRTGTFIAVERLMKHVHDYEEVDVFSLVREMRKYRNFMVQTEDQYVYIHECVRDYLKSLNEAPSEISATESQLFLNKSDL